MILSKPSIEDLRFVLQKEIGHESVSMLTDEELNQLGSLFLTIFAEALKNKAEKESI